MTHIKMAVPFTDNRGFENVWVRTTGPKCGVVDNVPMFCDLGIHDEVEFDPQPQGPAKYLQTVRKHTRTWAVQIPYPPNAADIKAIMEFFVSRSVPCEMFGGVIAIGLPVRKSSADVQKLLKECPVDLGNALQ